MVCSLRFLTRNKKGSLVKVQHGPAAVTHEISQLLAHFENATVCKTGRFEMSEESEDLPK